MDLKLPELGEGVHEGELLKWKVKPGDSVKEDQVLAEIMTDKATVELPSSFHGKVTELNAKEGSTVKVGQTILTYEGAAGKTTASPSASAPVSAPAQRAPAPAAQGAAPVSVSSGASVLAAPSTRRMARELGVDLGQISGSGPHGRVMREDLEKGSTGTPTSGGGATAAGRPMLAKLPTRTTGTATQTEERIPFRGLRKKISEKMRLSKDKAAHFTYVEEADATELVKLRTQAKELGAGYGVKVTFLPFVMKAMVAALRKYPTLNSSLDEEKAEIVVKHYFNIGLSIQTEAGLTAPVIKDVANKSVLELARDIEDVVNRARANKLTMHDFEDSTITLTNAGSIGGLFATPVINFPEVAIVGFNKIFRKPVVKEVKGPHGLEETIVIRDWTYLSISLDHRVIDGATGAEFMKEMIRYIENPALLTLI